MKKLISLVLAIMLIASTLVCAIPLSISAAEAPIEATPLTGFTANQVFNKAYVNLVMPEVTKKFVTADGLRVTQRDAAAGPYTPTSSSQILIRMFYADAAKNGYALPTDFASKGSFIMYVNVPSANKMHWQFTTTYGANYQTTCESAPNATYEYVAVGGDTWSTATTDENGAFVFDGAFEGYIKVSTSSIKCLDKVTVTYAYLGFMGIRLEGIGGDYGEVVAGPLFVTTDDSTSTKIAVPDEFKPAPIKAIPLIGYEKGTAFSGTRLPLILMLLAGGSGDAMSKVFEVYGNASGADLFLFYTFVSAFVLCVVLIFVKKERIDKYSILFGVLVGIPNFFSAKFLLMSLGSLSAVIVYPTFSVATILVVTVAGVCLFKERLKKKQWAALAVILAALVMLNI